MRSFYLRVIICVAMVMATGCSDDNSDNNSNTAHATNKVEVSDFTGQKVVLTSPAKRVIALAPHIVENVYTAGAGNQLVGVVAYSNYPEQATSLPLVGGYAKTNLEKIIELNPDLVIAWESGNSTQSINRIKELGFPVYIDQPDTLEDIARSIRDIGALTGQQKTADTAADNFLSTVTTWRERYQSVPSVTAFYQVWNSPLQTINGGHIISDAIQLCGGSNIYANEAVVAPIINIESILDKDPQAIIASGMSSSRPEWLDEWKQWPSLTAVKQNNLFFVDPDHIQRHTVRILLGIQAICEQLEQARQQ